MITQTILGRFHWQIEHRQYKYINVDFFLQSDLCRTLLFVNLVKDKLAKTSTFLVHGVGQCNAMPAWDLFQKIVSKVYGKIS